MCRVCAHVCVCPLTEAAGNPIKVFWSTTTTAPSGFILAQSFNNQGLFWTRWLTLHQQDHVASLSSPLCLPSSTTTPLSPTLIVLGGSSCLHTSHQPCKTPPATGALSTRPVKGGVQLLVSLGTRITRVLLCDLQSNSSPTGWRCPTSQFCLARCNSALNSTSFAERKGRVIPSQSRSFSFWFTGYQPKCTTATCWPLKEKVPHC